jgi:glycosyltransferase involved in cell wall biosynthesis
MRLNWFSPLPPAQTGVAEFTARILPALAQRFDITLWTETKETDREIARHATVRPFAELPATDCDQGAISVFNIGNNRPFHEKILQLCRKRPGIVILHELDLPELRARFFFKAARMSPMQLALKRAIGAVVHSRAALEIVQKEARCPVRFHFLPYPASDRPPTRQKDRDGAARLIIFGFLDANRRLETVLRALQSYPKKRELRLDVYGELSKPLALRRLTEKLALTDIVTFHGFVPSAELDKALDQADLAINLRHPTMGEASGSQLKIWDHALPSLVTPTGSYLDLPPGTVGLVNVETEIADLHHHFDRLLCDPEFYRVMGEQGRAALISNHRPADYVDALAALVDDAQHLTSPARGEKTVRGARI